MENKINLNNVRLGIAEQSNVIKFILYNDNGDDIIATRDLNDAEIAAYFLILSIKLGKRFGEGRIVWKDINAGVNFEIFDYNEETNKGLNIDIVRDDEVNKNEE